VPGIRSLSAWRPIGNGLWAAVAVSLVISITPWAQVLLYPFKLFTTWVHECGHALMTVLVGGHVTWITIAPDTSGLTHSLVPVGRVARGLVASSGYLGAAVVGCLLVAATRVEKWAHVILLGLGVFMLLTAALWMRNLFGFAVVLAWGAALVALARQGIGRAPRFVLSLLAIQVALNSVYDIRVLFLIDGGQSDAATMAQLFLAPAWAWATLWMLTSVAMLGATLWMTRRIGGTRLG
jgi:asparagine N-glycosylation enzyme membrane subunit Stt3